MIARGTASLWRLGDFARHSVNLVITYCQKKEFGEIRYALEIRDRPAKFTNFSETDCPEPLAVGLIRPVRSEDVRAYHRAWARRRYLQRIEEGRCIRCGKLTENGPRCRFCQSLHRTMRSGRWDAKARQQRKFSRWALQDERRQAGLCVLCGEPYHGRFVRCRRCRTRERQRPSYLRRRSGDAA